MNCEMNEQEICKEILERAAKETENLLPRKSKDVHVKEYDRFQRWMVEHSTEITNETVLLGYFAELSESFAPSSLWTKYSQLKKTLLVNKNINIGSYCKLEQFLKQQSKGYVAKKSKVLTREEVLKFIHEVPSEIFLMVKVALLFGVFGGFRRQELVNMLVDHIEDMGSVLIVNVPETKTDKKRVFTIIDEKEMNSLKLVRKYMSLRPSGCKLKRFFLNYKNSRCTAQPIGKNTFGKIPTIARYLGVSDAEKYTGHCLRRTSATMLADAGASMTTLKRHGGWKSTTVVEGYLEDSMSSKNKISRMLAGVHSSSENNTNCVGELSFSVKENSSNTTTNLGIGSSSSGNITFKGPFSNCNFFINEKK